MRTSILTEDQRFSIYCILLAEAEAAIKEPSYVIPLDEGNRRVINYGLCLVLYNLTLMYNAYPLSIIELTELYEQQPSNHIKHGAYWFSRDVKGWKQRIKLLKKAISLIENN